MPIPSPSPSPSPSVCLEPNCEGDLSFCMDPDYDTLWFNSDGEPWNCCCEDSYCSVCHSNGCNQCCDGSYKPTYTCPCIPGDLWDTNATQV